MTESIDKAVVVCPNCKSIKVIYYLDGDKQECYICHTCNYTAAKKEFKK